MNRSELYRAEREKGLTYIEIAKKYGVSKQRVACACSKFQPARFTPLNEKNCPYVNLRKWVNDNKLTKAELLRRLGYEFHSANYQFLKAILSGKRDIKKSLIDTLIVATGLTYEQLFAEDVKGSDSNA